MRQPCKTRPFSFATLVCPYCQDRFVLLRLCWFLSVWPVSCSTQALDGNFIFDIVFITLSPNFFLRTTFVLFARISMTFALPVSFKTHAPSFPKASAKLHLFPELAKSFAIFFQIIFTPSASTPHKSAHYTSKIFFNKKERNRYQVSPFSVLFTITS